MRDWKAAVRTWERNNFNRAEDGKKPEKIWSKRSGAIDERAYSPGELDAKIYDPIEEILRKQEAGV